MDELVKKILIQYTASKGLLDQVKDEGKTALNHQQAVRQAVNYIQEQNIENTIDATVLVALRQNIKINKAVLEVLGVEVT